MGKTERSRIIRDPNDEAYHTGLQCCVLTVRYDYRTRHARLDMEDGDCCDMTGCIAFFKAIDPQVRMIETFSGPERDTSYVKQGDSWRVINGDGELVNIVLIQAFRRRRLCLLPAFNRTRSRLTEVYFSETTGNLGRPLIN